MQHEMDSISKSETWTLEKLPPGKRPITSRWVYKTKVITKGKVQKLKMWIVTGVLNKPMV
jgi:hypothetical protein